MKKKSRSKPAFPTRSRSFAKGQRDSFSEKNSRPQKRNYLSAEMIAENNSPTTKPGEVIGKLRILRSGRAFVIPNELGHPEIPIERGKTNTALDGDLVKVRERKPTIIFGRRGKTRSSTPQPSEIIGVVQRNRRRIVGIFRQSDRVSWIECIDAGLPPIISLPPADQAAEVNPQPGQWCTVELADWNNPRREPTGKVLEVLGWQDDPGCDIRVIMARHQIPHRFPDDILDVAESISETIPPEEFNRRENWTNLPVITIDPATAKDHDDAIWLKKLPNGNWQLAVHIADVSWYVSENSSLDDEAKDRGNSTYLVDRVVPMLPARLCNNLCSLREGEVRLAKTCFMEFNPKAHRISYKFYDSFIKVAKRLNYEEALDILNNKPIPNVADEIRTMILDAGEFTQLLRKYRFTQGALDLDLPKVQVLLNPEGQPVALETDKTDPSHQLVEECMLAANDAVAHALREKLRPTIYRIHENPDEARLEEFQETAKLYGFDAGDLSNRKHLQELIEKIKGSPEEQALMTGLLKSLKRACYSPDPEGHFGLAKTDYCHFTSPIRRYADIVVHRSLDALLEKAPIKTSRPLPKAELQEIARHISDTERQSADAEQETQKVKMLEFLALQTEAGNAEKLAATVLEIKPIGIMIEIPALQIRGMVKKSDFPKNRWYLDEANRQWQSFDGKQIRVGDNVIVTPKQIDFIRMLADFDLLELAAEHRSLMPNSAISMRSRKKTGKRRR